MRKHFIDNLRWIDVLLLIPYHAAQAFNTWGEKNYVFFEPDRSLSSFIVFFSPFFMPLLFLLAGMSTKYSLIKRTYGQYIAERVKRLIVPLVSGTLVLCPVLSYIGDKVNCGYEGSFFSHYKVFFTRWTDLTGFDGGFNVGQFWFLLYLFVISLVSAGIIAVVKNISRKDVSAPDIPFPVICLFVIPLPFLYDLLSIGGKSFAEYIYIFLLGYFIMSDDRMIDKAEKYRHVTLISGLICCVLNVYMFIWSGKDFGYINAAVKALAEWFMILGLIGSGRHVLEFKGRISGFMSARSFPYFSIHFVWTVLFQHWLSGISGSGLLFHYLIPVAAAFIATMICSEICLRVPPLRFLTGTGSAAGKSRQV